MMVICVWWIDLVCRCRQFPSLVNCCTIDWFDEWPTEALLSVSKTFLEQVDLGSLDMRSLIAELCVYVHKSVAKMTEKYYLELRRRHYITPTTYLELINLCILFFTSAFRIRCGLNFFALDSLQSSPCCTKNATKSTAASPS